MKRVHVVSGRVECPDSLHLAACLERFFLADGCELVASREEADIVVLNGCERIIETPEVVRAYRSFARSNPDTSVLVVGCVPREVVSGDPIANFHLVPFRDLVKDPSLIGPRMGFSSSFALLNKDDVFDGRFPLEERYPGDPPAAEICLLTIGSGCHGGCTFCTIRRGRGTSCSLPPDEILGDARAAVEKGRFRFVLLGDDAGCWGHERGLDLPWLLGQLVEVCPAARFLVRPLNPTHLPAMFARLRPFFDRIDYLYLPLQSGSDRILRLMNRGYEAGPLLDLLRLVRKDYLGTTLKTDIIVGFPGETPAEFQESLTAAEVFHQAAFHRFVAYPDTPAALLSGRLDPAELAARLATARRLGHHIVDPSTYSYDGGVGTPSRRDGLKRIHVVTGNSECVNNVYLAVCLERFFESHSCIFSDAEDDADVLVLNVCNVLVETSALIEKYRGVARAHPGKQVLVLGCVPGGVAPSHEEPNFHVIGFGRLVREPSLIGPGMGFSGPFSLLKADEALFGVLPPGRLRFPSNECCFITISSGCEGRCTYCSIRAGRGAARSVAPDEIVADAKAGMATGRSRFVLIADDAGCWGRDLGLDLPDLLGRLCDACPAARFMLLDFNPRSLPGMLDRLRPFLDRIDYLYLPLQSGSDRVLSLMNREYRAGEVLAAVRQVREARPDIILESDVIVGFPGESREEFLQSIEAAKLFDGTAFVPYVPKHDTPAAAFPGRIDPEEMRLRMAIVREHAPAFGFKPIDTSISGQRHGNVGKLGFDGEPASDAPAAGHARVVDKARTTPVLRRPREPCLARYHTVDLTEGCPYECRYCDVELAAGAGSPSIVLYSNTVERLRQELDGRRTPLELVCFSSESEPFVPEPRVLATLRECMRLLLDRGIFLLVETRSAVPPEFLELFARFHGRVKVQVGLSTLDERVRALLEPRAASVGARLATLRELGRRGVPIEVAVGPLTPELEDSAAALGALFAALAECGARRGALSFLELVTANRLRLAGLRLDSWSFDEMAPRIYPREAPGCGGGRRWRADPAYRDRKHREIAALATAHGIELKLCRCNNPDQVGHTQNHDPLPRLPAVPGGPAAGFEPEQLTLLEPFVGRLRTSAKVQVQTALGELQILFPDDGQPDQQGRVFIRPWRPLEPCYRQVGTFALTYSGQLTRATARVAAAVEQWLLASAAR